MRLQVVPRTGRLIALIALIALIGLMAPGRPLSAAAAMLIAMTLNSGAVPPAAAVAIDSTVLSLLSIFGGVLVTVIVGLLAAWIQGRREHRKWLREKRYEAYRAFMVDMNSFGDLMRMEPTLANVAVIKKRSESLTDAFAFSFEAVSLLGPREVNAAGQRWTWAARELKADPDTTSFNTARWNFLVAAGKVLSSANVGASPLQKPPADKGPETNA